MASSEDAGAGGAEDTRRKIIQRRKQEEPLYYRDYLRVNELLSLQQPRSREAGAEAHDELLFIIVHQAYELWFKQILHEIDSVRAMFAKVPVNERLVGVAVARLQRVTVIQGLLLQQLSVLETMRPVDFLDFRDYLYPASGFQSKQFRIVENALGLRPSERLKYGEKSYCSYLAQEDAAAVEASEATPSLHDLVEAWLERTPFLQMAEGKVEGIDQALADAGSSAGSEAGGEAGGETKAPSEAGSAASNSSTSTGSGGGFTWWQHYQHAVTSMLEADEAAILAHPALAASLPPAGTILPAGAQQFAGGPSTREIALRDLAATRKHFDTILDEKQYEAARARGERKLSYRAMQAALLITLYSDEPILQLPARLLGALLDIDENMTAWRHRHALMVHRMLGVKMGTGGSSGYHYLRATAERHRVFQDLFNLSTFLIPRQLLPPLPRHVRAKLGFAHDDIASPTPRDMGRPGEVDGVDLPAYRPQLGPAFASLTAAMGHLSLHPAPGVPGPVPGQSVGSLVAGVGAQDVGAARREAMPPHAHHGHGHGAGGGVCPMGHGAAPASASAAGGSAAGGRQ